MKESKDALEEATQRLESGEDYNQVFDKLVRTYGKKIAGLATWGALASQGNEDSESPEDDLMIPSDEDLERITGNGMELLARNTKIQSWSFKKL